MSLLPTYQGFSAIYDSLMEEAPYKEWLQFLLNAMKKSPLSNKKVLDLGCGTGRLASMMAKEGFQMTGVDLSEEMLSMASQRIIADRIPVFPLIQQDMRDLELNEQFELIYSFCDSLNYLLEGEDLSRTFMRVAEHLEAGGLFIFDVHSPYKITHIYATGPLVDEDEALSYIWIPEVDKETLRVDHHIHFFVQEKDQLYRRFSEIHQQRAYTIAQLTTWLQAAKLEILSITADFNDSAPDNESERLFFVAQKQA